LIAIIDKDKNGIITVGEFASFVKTYGSPVEWVQTKVKELESKPKAAVRYYLKEVFYRD